MKFDDFVIEESSKHVRHGGGIYGRCSCDIGLRWRSLLIELHSVRGFVVDDEISEELKIFLA